MGPIELEGFHYLQYHIGGLINYYGILEKVLERIINHHYIGTDKAKGRAFKQDILQSRFFSFEFKRMILQKILDNNYPNDKGKNKLIIKKLIKIQEIRNRLAHGAILAADGDHSYENHEDALVDWQGTTKKVMPLLKEFEIIREDLIKDLSKVPGVNVTEVGRAGIKFINTH